MNTTVFNVSMLLERKFQEPPVNSSSQKRLDERGELKKRVLAQQLRRRTRALLSLLRNFPEVTGVNAQFKMSYPTQLGT